MNSIVSEITKEENYWDFKYAKKDGIHKLGKYPATMVAPMQYELLRSVIGNRTNLTLLDPFCGSGTSLVEGINLGLDVIGIDINPYAILLSEVKTKIYEDCEVDSGITQIMNLLNSSTFTYNQHSFDNIEKWFTKSIIDKLSKIKCAIEVEKNQEIRKFFWVCLSEVIYKYSNDRTSTFKLHVKTKEDIKKIKTDCIEFFIKIIEKNRGFLHVKNNNMSLSNNVNLMYGDSKDSLKHINHNSVDIICTSPPYGDNATTVTYGQFSILFLKWISQQDLKGTKEVLNTYSEIDNISLGGNKKDEGYNNNFVEIKRYVNTLTEGKQRKVINFFNDYYQVLINMQRVLKNNGYLLMTTGNRKVDGLEQPLDKITIEIANSLGLKLVKKFDRKILNKSMPLRVSNICDKGAVRSMEKEDVLIFIKEIQ